MHVKIQVAPQKLQAIAKALEQTYLWKYIPKNAGHRETN
jgi:hypothetical protein